MSEEQKSILMDSDGERSSGDSKEYLTLRVENQMFGIPVLQIEDVLGEQTVTPIPLAPPEISGSLNLRGRIVTAVNLRRRLGMDVAPPEAKNMSIVVEHNGDLYSLTVDSVGDVLSLPLDDFEKNPATLDAAWRDVSAGIYRLEEELLVVLDVSGILDTLKEDAAA